MILKVRRVEYPNGRRELSILTAAIFSLIGVVVGVVLSALLNFFLQRTQDRRRWEREDKLKFEPERLVLYRDFLHGMNRVHSWEESDYEKLSSILSEMELLSSRAVSERAYAAFRFAEELREAWGDEKVTRDKLYSLDGIPEDAPGEFEDHLQELIYRFNRAVRKELGVVTEWKPTVLKIKGKPVGVPEDLEQIREPEKRSWWQRWFGG